MHWLSLALLCAFSLATCDALTKKWLSDYAAEDIVLVRFVWTSLLLLPLLLIQSFPPMTFAFWRWMIVLVPLEILALWLYMRAITTDTLAQTLPYLSFTPVFIVVVGFAVLGEHVTAKGFSGILLVVAGCYLLNARVGNRAAPPPGTALLRRPGPKLMLMVAAIYSLTAVLGKGAMQQVTPQFFGPFYYCLPALFTLLLHCRKHRGGTLAILFKRPAAHFIIGLTSAAMIITHYLAIAQIEVAYMIAVKRSSLLMGIVYGWLFFQESGFVRHFFSGVLMLCGIALISL